MTIDEAITHAREVAKEKYNEGFLCHANPDDGELDGCVKCAQEHEQLAEWLEELQRYRAIGEISTCRNAVEICRAMIERGIEPDNIKEYIAFEDNLVQKGYDLKRLLEMMEEHKQYRAIGTVEECQVAMEKQTAKKLIFDKPLMVLSCSICGHYAQEVVDDNGSTRGKIPKYCSRCGQKLDWSDDDDD